MPDTVVVCMPRRIPLPSIGNFVLCFPHEMVQYSAGKSSEPWDAILHRLTSVAVGFFS